MGFRLWARGHPSKPFQINSPPLIPTVSPQTKSLIYFRNKCYTHSMKPEQLLKYMIRGVESLIQQGKFPGGQEYRQSQIDALHAYHEHMTRTDLSLDERLQFIFEIATGIGKTPLEVAIIHMAQVHARQDGQVLKAALVVPTELLMDQTYDEAAKFTPDMVANIGRYGGDFRELDFDTTIIISASFLRLVESGKINSDTHQIIVSDEGHNETSERRVDATHTFFDDRTLRLSVTATGDYDEEKSVSLTHGAHRFERPFTEGVKLGELSSYYRTQLHLIRVAPPSVEEELEAAANGVDRLKYEMRKKAWRKFVVEHFATGYDDQTGDPLSDNYAGFYGADTLHVDDTVIDANNHPLLRRKAEAMGLKGVAVGIHSHMKAG